MRLITILGDSIARGLMYDPGVSRYTLCRDTYASALQSKGYQLKNLARVGGTVDNALELYEQAEKKPGTLLAVEVGGNDSALNWEEVASSPDKRHEAKVPLKDFGAKLRALLTKAKDARLMPIVVTPLPVVARNYLNWISKGLDRSAIERYLGGAEYIYRWQERYALEALKAAQDTECHVFDLRSVFLYERDFASLMCIDGIHPNPAGYRLISAAVMEFAKRAPHILPSLEA